MANTPVLVKKDHQRRYSSTVVFHDTAYEYSIHTNGMNPANAGKPHMTVVKYDNPQVKGFFTLVLEYYLLRMYVPRYHTMVLEYGTRVHVYPGMWYVHVPSTNYLGTKVYSSTT